MSAQIYLCLLTTNDDIVNSLEETLTKDYYHLCTFHSSDTFLEYILEQREQIDCLILEQDQTFSPSISQLKEDGKLLPTVILANVDENERLVYHPAQVEISVNELSEVPSAIERAITDFLQLTPNSKPEFNIQEVNEFLTIKQNRLTKKLQERLGYKGVYYKRNPEDFFRNLDSSEKKALLEDITEEYRLILLEYFNTATDVNSRIDQFVMKAFFADLSVSKIMEIHMDLMDQFSQQLKLEGRSDEILLDYRLTLIDIIAHLCEMYRRSLPTKTLK
ncbi:circadian clock protein KaiA [Euhalothece natronophila Z-M001]|uniref:Circadian clock oscillator protein KaiA n=1 Tax=Euhalothece natronophila Z-M001 TaxID=522448 RepID=A0A5B8NP48_9CHRO|nr:circadian clock protein KaiA [Euhalothece natronophila]QDZ39959.1 circadian clock protein KaiA [Euhalothece natronophila Z-M001]